MSVERAGPQEVRWRQEHSPGAVETTGSAGAWPALPGSASLSRVLTAESSSFPRWDVHAGQSIKELEIPSWGLELQGQSSLFSVSWGSS